jgi:hypothetical protein
MNNTNILVMGLCCLLLLDACSSPRKHAGKFEPTFEEWVQQTKLEPASEDEVTKAKQSEVKVSKRQAQMDANLIVGVHVGTSIGGGSNPYSTTSYYELRNSTGISLERFPSRFASNGFDGGFRVWANSERSMILVYEWMGTGVDVHEFHFVFIREDQGWTAHGVVIPKWAAPSPVPTDPEYRPGFIGPYGPDTIGISDGFLIVVPKRGTTYRVRAKDLESMHPFPFIVG